MAQINLLKQKSASQNFLEGLPALIVKLLVVVLIGVLVYYGWIYLKQRDVDGQIVELQERIAQSKQSVLENENRNELFTRQAQLQELDKLIEGHLYWSQLMPALANVTLKSANYSGLKILDDGEITLKVTVPDLVELDKFLQVFDLPSVNSKFSNVRIGSFHKVQDEDNTVLSFDVKMQYNPEILKYQSTLK